MTKTQLITNFKNNKMNKPRYAITGDAGFDLQANITKHDFIYTGETKLIKTGIKVQLPSHEWELQIRSRSGLAHKYGVCVLNSPGTIDSGYTGEIGVLLHNSGERPFRINPGDRIAQAVLSRVYHCDFIEVSCFTDTERGGGGFGSTATCI